MRHDLGRIRTGSKDAAPTLLRARHAPLTNAPPSRTCNLSPPPRRLTDRARAQSVATSFEREYTMLKMKGLVAALAASALAATPALAAAPSAQALSITQARAAKPAAKGENIAEGSTATLINVGILAALVVVVLLVAGGDDNDSPNSP